MHTGTRESRKYVFPVSVRNLNERSTRLHLNDNRPISNDIEHACATESKMIYKQMIARMNESIILVRFNFRSDKIYTTQK